MSRKDLLRNSEIPCFPFGSKQTNLNFPGLCLSLSSISQQEEDLLFHLLTGSECASGMHAFALSIALPSVFKPVFLSILSIIQLLKGL